MTLIKRLWAKNEEYDKIPTPKLTARIHNTTAKIFLQETLTNDDPNAYRGYVEFPWKFFVALFEEMELE